MDALLELVDLVHEGERKRLVCPVIRHGQLRHSLSVLGAVGNWLVLLGAIVLDYRTAATSDLCGERLRSHGYSSILLHGNRSRVPHVVDGIIVITT